MNTLPFPLPVHPSCAIDQNRQLRNTLFKICLVFLYFFGMCVVIGVFVYMSMFFGMMYIFCILHIWYVLLFFCISSVIRHVLLCLFLVVVFLSFGDC